MSHQKIRTNSYEMQRNSVFNKDLLQANNAVNNIYNYSKINIPLYGIHELLVMRKVL